MKIADNTEDTNPQQLAAKTVNIENCQHEQHNLSNYQKWL
jgi:hypothetical protein